MRKLFLSIFIFVLVISLSACGANTGNGPTITEVNVPEKVSTNASYMISIETEEEADISINTDNGEIIEKESYDNKIEWKTSSSETEANLNIIAKSDQGNTTMNKKVNIIKPPVVPISYNLYTDSIGSKFVDITFVNNANKEVTAIDLKIIGWNNFGERMYVDLFGEDYTINATASSVSISPGAESTHTWGYLDIEFINPVTKVEAYVTRVAYVDGTTWELN